jgi:hypothetical protein
MSPVTTANQVSDAMDFKNEILHVKSGIITSEELKTDLSHQENKGKEGKVTVSVTVILV